MKHWEHNCMACWPAHKVLPISCGTAACPTHQLRVPSALCSSTIPLERGQEQTQLPNCQRRTHSVSMQLHQSSVLRSCCCAQAAPQQAWHSCQPLSCQRPLALPVLQVLPPPPLRCGPAVWVKRKKGAAWVLLLRLLQLLPLQPWPLG
jgi:hypothetical protein